MATGEDWTQFEVEATVADYMHMLTLELSGMKYNKTEHRKELLRKLDGRSEGAIERKHQNISAVLRDLDCHWIPGYKPLGNSQRLLADCVEQWILSNPKFDIVSQDAAERPAVVPSSVNFQRLVVAPPRLEHKTSEPTATYRIEARSAVKRDFLARESRNSALGKAGEMLVLEYEEFRLRSAGMKHLAERIEHVSDTRGDGLGYDILSFELNGAERFVEVKTTSFAKETPFFASRNEVEFAREVEDKFHLYRLFDFRKTPKLFSLQGPIESHCTLDPSSYLCRYR